LAATFSIEASLFEGAAIVSPGIAVGNQADRNHLDGRNCAVVRIIPVHQAVAPLAPSAGPVER
jgi:hypothetical protein